MSGAHSSEGSGERGSRTPRGKAGLWVLRMATYPAGENQLAVDEVWHLMDDGFARREAADELTVQSLVALPDCLLALMEFHPGEEPRAQMAEFRYWLSECAGVRWQRDWTVSETAAWESWEDVATAMRQAPVVAGLAAAEEEWPYRRA